MAFQVQENTNFPRFQQHFAPLQHRPMLLKDFLRDDASPQYPCCTTSSSSPSKKSTAVSSKSNKSSSHIVLLRSWSERAAATRISAVHKVIKLLQLASSKSPSVLPRSISRRLTKRLNKDDDDIIFGDAAPDIKVKVKDILRWRSFRDLVEDDVPTPLDFPPSPYRSTAAATTTTTTTTTTSCSKRSSWCDSDFTAEELPPWGGENDEFWGKNAATLKNHKRDWSSSFEEEYEQQSPVSVLDSPFRQVQDFTHFHPILSKIDQRAKCGLTRRTQEVNVAEEKAKQLLSQIKEDDKCDDDDRVMLDFFMDELSINGNWNDDEFDCKILRIAESWMEGEFEESYEWDVEEDRASFVKDMEKGICWNKFKQEQQELCEDLEVRILDHLFDDLVADFLIR